MNSAGVEPLKAFTCDQESVWHAHEGCNAAQPCPSKQCLYCRGLDMVYVLTHVVHHPYSPDLFRHVMSMCMWPSGFRGFRVRLYEDVKATMVQ